jgi:hypothetical protein
MEMNTSWFETAQERLLTMTDLQMPITALDFIGHLSF